MEQRGVIEHMEQIEYSSLRSYAYIRHLFLVPIIPTFDLYNHFLPNMGKRCAVIIRYSKCCRSITQNTVFRVLTNHNCACIVK